MNYVPYYPGGWKNLPDRSTPERAEALQNIEQRLMDIDTGALSNTYLPHWKPTTAYTAGDAVLSPTGDVVTAIASFTSGSSYNPDNWQSQAQLQALIYAAALGGS